MPSFARHVASTAGQPVDTMPSGLTTYRATSDSFFVPGRVAKADILCRFLLRPLIDAVDVLHNVRQPPRQRRQITRRTRRVKHRLLNPLTHRHQQLTMGPRRLLRRLIRLHRPKAGLTAHVTPPDFGWSGKTW